MSTRPCALVTGGSRGIGRAVAVRLAEDGFDVAFCFRSGSAAAAETARLAEAAGARCFHEACDVADGRAAAGFVQRAEAELGPIHALVNSAGIVRDNPMVLMPPEDWSAVIETNLTGTFNVCRSALLGMLKRRAGVIVNMSSVAGVYGHAGQANYSAAKAGVNGMSRALAKEVAGRGVRVNVVAPGFIDTDMTTGLSGKAREQAMGLIPLRRFGSAAAVAELTSFLVSDRADYITGQVIQIDGGIAL
ncbi:3-oxoacyl-[acyl-carrier-protein] reductase [Paractinoplanes deccanensis]|uniref:3-oxoacyl-[acyl-carrier-protein] reductase n=1 Tax=Paractinoplanes deccanensis TaxID=113561 RepID=A0ABQ3XY78_9ACTN|nr:3-oxoacyl-ACP reductase FabG [Actinoplanes deccanensis]GID72698.1 3-oxoacyl-[acyl-carrier-protein] reductase [Actinoplanes deccanensis]